MMQRNRIYTYTYLFLLVIIIGLSVYIHVLKADMASMKDTISLLETEKAVLQMDITEKKEQIDVLEKDYERKKEEISEITDKMDILVTFKDAGLKSQSVSDIRNLLDIANRVPYGSPFKSGHYLTSYYGERDELNFGGSPNGHHAGVDIKPKEKHDTIIRSTADGEIVDFGISETLGKYIVFETEGGYRMKYGHLDTIFWQDAEKQTVKDIPIKKGDKLGIMGSTGSWSTGPHLHLEMHYQKDDDYVELNPRRILEYIGGYEKGG